MGARGRCTEGHRDITAFDNLSAFKNQEQVEFAVDIKKKRDQIIDPCPLLLPPSKQATSALRVSDTTHVVRHLRWCLPDLFFQWRSGNATPRAAKIGVLVGRPRRRKLCTTGAVGKRAITCSGAGRLRSVWRRSGAAQVPLVLPSSSGAHVGVPCCRRPQRPVGRVRGAPEGRSDLHAPRGGLVVANRPRHNVHTGAGP